MVLMQLLVRVSRLGASLRLGLDDLPRVAGVLAIVAGSTALSGWFFGLDVLRSFVPGAATMEVTSAIALVLLGLGLVLVQRATTRRDRRIAVLPIMAGVLVALIVGSQHLNGPVDPDRMAPITAISFVLLGVAMVLIVLGRGHRVAAVLALGTFAVAALDLLDLLFGSSAAPLLSGPTHMAPGTAVALTILSVGTIGLLAHRGLLAAMIGQSSSARSARRLIAASLVVPVVLAWLRLQGEARGIYGIHSGASLIVLGTFLFLTAMILWTARASQRTDAARQAAIEERDRFFDMSIDMLATASAGGIFVRLNPAWTRVLGYELEQLTSRPFVDFVHPDDVEATNREVARQIDEGKSVLNFQNRYRHRDGSYRWLEWTSTPSADGTLLYAVARDVTERKIEDEQLRAPALALARRRTEARDRIQMVIETAAFGPVYQPVVDLSSGATVGYEALTRFSDGSRPDIVFASARESGLGIELEVATMRAAFAGAQTLPSRVWLSLNVSPALLADVALMRSILGLRSRDVVLEITEHETIDAYGPLRDAMTRLVPGVRLAVDDAGAGVANFRHLVELRPDFVKIDLSLVQGVDSDVSRQAVVAGILHFARAASCQVIAEGIETDAERSMIRELGVSLGQGFLLGRPAPVEEWLGAAATRPRRVAGRRIEGTPSLPRVAG